MARPTLGSRLAQMLREHQLSPAALAKKAGTTEATISNWLNDKVQTDHVKAKQLYDIATAVEASPFWLLLGEGTPNAIGVREDGPDYVSHPVSRETLRIALQQVSEVVDKLELPMTPEKRAELTLAVCEMLDEGMPEAKVLRFVRAAAA